MSRAQKLPLQRGTVSFTHARILDEIKKRGYALPCHITSVNGPIVNVSFDVEGVALPGNVPLPTYGSRYVREPYQVNDRGFTFPLAVDVSALVGLGSGVPSMVLPANFSALFWFPAPDVDWDAVDPNALTLTGLDAINMNAPVAATSQNLSAGTGASGVFTSADGQTITVLNGIIVNMA